jgi:hypothetical protein
MATTIAGDTEAADHGPDASFITGQTLVVDGGAYFH